MKLVYFKKYFSFRKEFYKLIFCYTILVVLSFILIYCSLLL